MFTGLNNLVDLLTKKPWAIFIVMSLGYGYAYYEQNKVLQKLNLEVGGLRVEQIKMNEIIKLKVLLAEQGCGD